MYKKTLTILIVLITILFVNETFGDDIDVREAIEKVNKHYNLIKSIKGRIRREVVVGDMRQEFIGKFLIKLPDKFRIEYITHTQQKIISDGEFYWFYSSDENKAVKKGIKEMSSAERMMLGLSSLFGLNFFEGLEEGYNFKFAGILEDDIVIAAEPKSGGKYISYILIKIDRDRWLVKSLEIFDLNSTIISQTIYKGFRKFSRDIWFPGEIDTSSLLGDESLKESLIFTRVEINSEVADDNFIFIPPKGTEILTQ